MNSSHGLCKCTAGAAAQRHVIENFQTGVKQSQNLESTSLSTVFFFSFSFSFLVTVTVAIIEDSLLTVKQINSYISTICTCLWFNCDAQLFFHWPQQGVFYWNRVSGYYLDIIWKHSKQSSKMILMPTRPDFIHQFTIGQHN